MNALELSDAKGVPIQSTLMIVNSFVVTSVRFLNHFSTIAEEKLNKISDSITRLEIEASLLEAKLCSIPWLEGNSVVPEVEKAPVDPNTNETSQDTSSSSAPASGDPAYEKYFKMLNLGLPKDAVKQKMMLEGLDPNVLDGNSSSSAPPPSNTSSSPPPTQNKPPPPPVQAKTETATAPPPKTDVAVIAVKDDPMFATYFRMLKAGIPQAQVAQKMSAEGFDPSILDMNPNDPSPNATSIVLTTE